MDSLAMDELPAVRALDSLFKLTEVHLWDDCSSKTPESSFYQEYIIISKSDDIYQRRDSERVNGLCLLPEDAELAEKLNELGLPLSFHTNKEKRNGMSSGKRKGTRKSNRKSSIEIDHHNHMLDSMDLSEEIYKSPANLIYTSRCIDNEIIKSGIMEDAVRLSLERDDSLSSTACTSHSTLSNEHDCTDDLSLGHSSEPVNNALDEVEHTTCTNEIVLTGLCLDDEISEGSCLMSENADDEGKGRKEDSDSVHTVPLLATTGQLDYINFMEIQDSDIAAEAQISELANLSMIDDHEMDDTGEWMVCWDDFYMRTYFYNVKTEVSTWEPPSGMEHLVYGNAVDEPTDAVFGLAELDNGKANLRKSDEDQASIDLQPELDLAEDTMKTDGSLSQQMDETAGIWSFADDFSNYTTQRKKKVRTRNSSRKSSSSEDYQGVLQEVVPTISKYWCQRYLLFSRFDYGIKMDEEGWFSVTPESLAKHHASRCGDGSVIDLFTGVGGNAIQFAQRSKHVIAIDIDPNKIEYARHNAALYGVHDNIDFVTGDSFALAPKLKANTVFMSPPWGGPDYSKVKKFDINTMLKPRDGQFLFNAGKEIASKIVMFLPRNVEINQLAELSLSSTPPWSLEVERNFLNGKLKGVTAYFLGPCAS